MKLIIAITLFLLNILHNADGLECNICDQRNWVQWGSCNQQCGGGFRSRHQEICCPESMDYDTCVHQRCKDIIAYEDIKQVEPCNTNCYNGGLFNGSCQCKPGWTGKCCQSRKFISFLILYCLSFQNNAYLSSISMNNSSVSLRLI